LPSLSSRERKWTRPDPSPANTQQRAGASQVKVAITVPVAKSHTLSVWSSEAETACIKSGVTATAFTWPQFPAAGEVTNLERLRQTLRQIGAVVPGVRNKDRLWSFPRSGCFPHTVTMASRCGSTGWTRSSQALAAPYPYVL